jgi:hypothetical protein
LVDPRCAARVDTLTLFDDGRKQIPLLFWGYPMTKDKSDHSGGKADKPAPKTDGDHKHIHGTRDKGIAQDSRENLEKATTDWMKPPRTKGK